MPPIVIVTGISGVGKSWLLNRAKESPLGQILSASALIAQELKEQTSVEQVAHDQLRELDIAANQAALSRSLARAVDPNAQRVLLDAHVVIDTSEGLEVIATDVFRQIGPSMFVFVWGAPDTILALRSQDEGRLRPDRTLEELVKQQTIAHARTLALAESLGVPAKTIDAGDVAALRRAVLSGKGAM